MCGHVGLIYKGLSLTASRVVPKAPGDRIIRIDVSLLLLVVCFISSHSYSRSYRSIFAMKQSIKIKVGNIVGVGCRPIYLKGRY